MDSNTFAKLVNQENTPFKIRGSITTANGGNTVYYCKPSVKCKLIGAKILVQTAAGANLSATGKITKETAVTDTDLLFDTITINTNVTAGTGADNDDLMQCAVASVASLIVASFYPGANYLTAENEFNPAESDAILISFAGGSNATLLAGTLELEFLAV
jgi:hypothetical protein